MDIRNFVVNILMIMLLTDFSAFAEDQGKNKERVFTNSDLKKYRPTTKSNDYQTGSTDGVGNNAPRSEKNNSRSEQNNKDSTNLKADLEPILRRQWEGLRAALKRKDIDSALTYFVESQRHKQRQIFEEIRDKLPTIMDTFVEFNIKSICGNTADYEIVARENGQFYSYPGRMVKDNDGTWKFYDF
jgi:hypothetical protein